MELALQPGSQESRPLIFEPVDETEYVPDGCRKRDFKYLFSSTLAKTCKSLVIIPVEEIRKPRLRAAE